MLPNYKFKVSEQKRKKKKQKQKPTKLTLLTYLIKNEQYRTLFWCHY